jgi:hypothetical protein
LLLLDYTWLLQSSGRLGSQVLEAIARFIQKRAERLIYNAQGDASIDEGTLQQAEDDRSVAPKLNALLEWCRERHDTLRSELERLDDVEELLDMGDNQLTDA